MITFKHYIFGVACLMAGLNACTDLDEKVYDRIDAGAYYQNEASVKGAVAAIYYQTSSTLAGENFFHLSEYPADQLTWPLMEWGPVGLGRSHEDRALLAELDFRVDHHQQCLDRGMDCRRPG